MPTSDQGDIFAGGDSLRDYGPLIEAARHLPGDVTIATHRKVADDDDLPANLRIGAVSHEEYLAMMRAALAIVVPLPANLERGAGQTTYLNAMAMGKLVVVTDSLGVREYVDHGLTGLIIPPGDAEALTETLSWIADPANRTEVERIGMRAREIATTRYSPHSYVENLLQVGIRALERH